jgi:hypothetical protein
MQSEAVVSGIDDGHLRGRLALEARALLPEVLRDRDNEVRGRNLSG